MSQTNPEKSTGVRLESQYGAGSPDELRAVPSRKIQILHLEDNLGDRDAETRLPSRGRPGNGMGNPDNILAKAAKFRHRRKALKTYDWWFKQNGEMFWGEAKERTAS